MYNVSDKLVIKNPKRSVMKVFKNGLLTGLLLQLAIGPVFFLIVNITLQRTVLDGFVAVLAVTIVDYLYITLALIGVGKLLQKKKFKKYSALSAQWF